MRPGRITTTSRGWGLGINPQALVFGKTANVASRLDISPRLISGNGDQLHSPFFLTKSPAPPYNRAHPDNYHYSAIGGAACNRAAVAFGFAVGRVDERWRIR